MITILILYMYASREDLDEYSQSLYKAFVVRKSRVQVFSRRGPFGCHILLSLIKKIYTQILLIKYVSMKVSGMHMLAWSVTGCDTQHSVSISQLFQLGTSVCPYPKFYKRSADYFEIKKCV